MDLNVIITTNGPGELSAWVSPVVDLIRTQWPAARIIIALVPCPHSSGLESRVGAQMYGTTVLTPKETLHYLLTGKMPSHVVLAQEGIVLHLGGDPLFSVSLGWRTHFPVVAYTENRVAWPALIQRHLLRDQEIYQKYSKSKKSRKMRVIGDLMADAVKPTLNSAEVRQKLNLSGFAPVVSLLPGSKPLKVLHSTAFMLKIADELSQLNPDIQFILPQSPYTPLAQLRKAVQDETYLSILDGVPGKIVHDRNSTFIVTPQGTKVQVIAPSWHYNALQISDLSITLPGTNTAELGTLGVPMVVILPLNKPEVLPLDGVPGLLSKIPLLGRWLKKGLIHLLLRRMRYVAIPNQKAQREIVPELIGQVNALKVADTAYHLLDNSYHRREVALTLKAIMKPQHAAQQLVSNLFEVWEAHYIKSHHLIPRPAASISQRPVQDSDSTSSEQSQKM